MKKIALFGAGDIGVKALETLGTDVVEFFFVNDRKTGFVRDVPVLTFDEFLKRKSDVHVIVTSTDYAAGMCAQLEQNGIYAYFVWDRNVLDLFSRSALDLLPRYSPIYCGYDWTGQSYSLIKSFYQFDLSPYSSIILYAYPETAGIITDLVKATGKFENLVAVVRHNEVAARTFGALKDQADCVICAVRHADNEIYDACERMDGIKVINLFDIVPFLHEYHSKEAVPFKDAYKGRRCFLIGNGPSLKTQDLDLLHARGEITFACNKIFNVFDQTKWRPDFYFLIDVYVLKTAARDCLSIKPKICSFYNYAFCNGAVLWNKSSDIIPLYHSAEQEDAMQLPRFSHDISVQHFLGASVAYCMLQAAFYLGFQEVYMIGFDHFIESLEKTERIDHFYDSSKEEVWNLTPEYLKIDNHIKLNNAYKSAKMAFDKAGRKIFNATRGGHLDIFDHIEFDRLF